MVMPTDRLRRRISIAERRRACWLVHRWGAWTGYQVTRPVRCIGPSLRHVVTTSEERRRRQCIRCRQVDDRLVETHAVIEHEETSEESSAV